MVKKRQTSGIVPKVSRSIDVGGHVGSMRLMNGRSPRYELRVDRDGRWYHEGIEIVRDDIRSHFSRHLVRDDNGNYLVRVGEDECRVVVEDAPFVVVRVMKERSGFSLLLTDGGKEPLDFETIEFRKSNVPYCLVRGGLEARLSRAAYYQLAEFIEYDDETGHFQIAVNGRTIILDAH